jgi:hypothetical protein
MSRMHFIQWDVPRALRITIMSSLLTMAGEAFSGCRASKRVRAISCWSWRKSCFKQRKSGATLPYGLGAYLAIELHLYQ